MYSQQPHMTHLFKGIFFLDKKDYLIRRDIKKLEKGSQELRKAYHDAGQFYWASYKTFSSKTHLYNGKSLAFLIPSIQSTDINETEDWKKAEALFKYYKNL